MLVRFVVSNFLSFHEEREFNMLAGNSLKTHKNHIFKAGKIDLLKASAIYGANGAGKSNLVKALQTLHLLIVKPKMVKSICEKKFKLSNSKEDEPIRFEIEVFLKKKFYSYGIILKNNSVIEEWLYETGISSQDKMIFERKLLSNSKTSIKIAQKYLGSQKEKLLIELMEDRLLLNDEPLLSKAKDFAIPEITTVKNWIEEGIQLIVPGSKFLQLIPMITKSKEFTNFTNTILATFDTGVNKIDVEKIDINKFFGAEEEKLKKELLSEMEGSDGVFIETHLGLVLISKEKERVVVTKVISSHKNNSGELINFDLDDESDGTKRLLDFIPAFYFLLTQNMTIVIDEIDQSIHPALLKMVLKKLTSETDFKGQLIFTTHESNLLDLKIFRQDEIWFAEKNRNTSATELYSLNDYKPRNDLDIRKGYLNGRFGAIPFLGNLEDLSWTEYV